MTMTKAIDLIKHNAKFAALIGVAIVLVAVTYIFYSGSQSSADQESTIERQLTSARQSLAVAQAQYDVATLQTDYDSLKYTTTFPASFPGVDLSSYIAAAADKYDVKVTFVTPKSPAGTETVGGTKYARYDTVVRLTGGFQDYPAIISFLSYLEAAQSGQFPSLRIENGSLIAEEDGTLSGSFTVVVLSQS